MKLSYLKGLRDKQLLSIEEITNVMDDCYVVHLRGAKELTWTPGEHGIFTLPGRNVQGRGFRPFSVASVPREKGIMLAMRTGGSPSSFKRTLLSLEKGETVTMRGPFGWFVQRDSTSPVVLIARGIGITPMRSLALSLADQEEVEVHLIHRTNIPLFRDFFEQLQSRYSRFSTTWPADERAFTRDIGKAADVFGCDAYWYLAASPGEVRRIRKQLKLLGICRSRIISDPFYGYKRQS